MLLRNSKISAGLTKEAKGVAPASWLAKLWHGAKAKPGATTWIERGLGAVGGKGGMIESALASVKERGLEPAIKAWKPQSMTGQAARWTAMHPMKAVGLGAGTAVAGGGVVQAAKGLSPLTPQGPEALATRQMQGFQ